MGELPEPYDRFFDDLRACAARAVASAGDARLVFIGRSPESLFDYLSGVLQETTWADRVELVNLSMRLSYTPPGKHVPPDAIQLLREHLTAHELTPQDIASGAHALTLVDLVSTGATFEYFVQELEDWALSDKVDVAAVRRRLKIVGITWRTKTSPNTFRWHQHASWLNRFPRIAVKNVSAPADLWHYLGNVQSKVSPSHPPWRWGDSALRSPSRDARHLEALTYAVQVHTRACMSHERMAFSAELAKQPAMRERWLRSLVSELRNG